MQNQAQHYIVTFSSPSGLHLRVASRLLEIGRRHNVVVAIGRSDAPDRPRCTSIIGMLLLKISHQDQAILRLEGVGVAVAECLEALRQEMLGSAEVWNAPKEAAGK